MGSSTIALAEAVSVEPTFLPEGWEIKVAGTAEAIDAPAPGGKLISADESTGEVIAIVGVTGIVDHVNDLIEVGAYSDTLAKRRPKVCWAHDWDKPIGRVKAIEEWAPGDPRFAQVKATLDGKPWPADAGALVAHTQFNMKSERGREAFAAVEFYSETGECEWSIGWQTVPGQTKRRQDGVRVCKKVELYEVSPVLFGAAPLTRTLQVKSIRLDDAYLGSIQVKVGEAAGEAPDENELHRLAMEEIDWTEVDAAAGDGPATPTTGDGEGDPAKSLADVVQLNVKSLDVDDLAAVDFDALLSGVTEAKAAESGADQNRGNAEELRRWYEEGEGAAQIRWSQPGDFMRCVRIAGKHMTPERAKGYCNLRHHGALGVYAGQEKSAGVLAAESLAKTWNPLLEVGPDAAHTERKHMSPDGGLRGSFEERREALDLQLTTTLREIHGDVPTETADGMVAEHGWVSIEGTWDDRVVATYVRYGPERIRQTYEVDYSWDGTDVALGVPRPVELQVSVVPIESGGELTAEDIEDSLFAPSLSVLDEGLAAVKAAMTWRIETKVGRVMSEANAQRLRGAIEHLLEVARAAGIDLPGWTGKDPDVARDDETPDTTAQPAPAVKTLSIDQVNADLAAFSNFLQ